MPVQFLQGFEPPSGDTKVWRYLDSEKFTSFIRESALYFAAARQFDDKFEGSITRADFDQRSNLLPVGPELAEFAAKITSNAFEQQRRFHKTSCWHMNPGESAAMWTIYLRERRGIAIQSTVDRLKAALKPYRIQPQYTEEEIWLGAVRYLDYRKDSLSGTGFLHPFFHKRSSYAYEREFRAVLTLRLADMFGVRIPDDGVFVPVDLSTLCAEIFVAPGAGDAYREAVQDVLAESNLNIPLHQSELDDEAMY